MKRSLVAALLLGMVAAGAGSTEASADDGKICAQSVRVDASLQACARLIRSGKIPRRKLAGTYFWRGIGYFLKKQYDASIAEFSEALSIAPNEKNVLIGRSAAYARNEDYELALRDIEDVLRVDPNSAVAYSNRAYVFYRRADYPRAMDDANHAIRLEPKAANAHKNRGLVYEALGMPDKALSDLRDALRLLPTVLDAADAIRRIEGAGAVSAVPQAAAAPVASAVDTAPCFGWSEDDAKLEACATLITSGKVRGEQLARAYGERGVIYHRMRNYDGAIVELSEALKHDPRNARAMYVRGSARVSAGDAAGGAADIDQAKAIDPGVGK